MRRFFLAGMPGVAAVAALALAPSATASAAPEAFFHLSGTHGYRITVDAQAGSPAAPSPKAGGGGVPKALVPRALAPKAAGDSVTVSAFRGVTSESMYSAPATVTPSRVRARLGGLGRVLVSFRAKRVRRVAAPRSCTGSIVERIGTFTGTIRFRGENGYTAADAVSVPGKVLLPQDFHCRTPRPQRSRAGTKLVVRSPSTYLAVLKNESSPQPLCVALATSQAGRVRILRLIVVEAGPGAFSFAPDLSAAHLDLPPPFVGVANFVYPHSLTGTLTASFPGAPDVPLAGPGYTARLWEFAVA